MPPGFDRPPAGSELNVDLAIPFEKILRDAHDGGFRRGDSQVGEKYGSDPFIHQNPAVLWIVAKLDDVEISVAGFKKMRLGAAAHLADQPDRVYRHELQPPYGGGRKTDRLLSIADDCEPTTLNKYYLARFLSPIA